MIDPEAVKKMWVLIQARDDPEAAELLRKLPSSHLPVIAAVARHLADMAEEEWTERCPY